MRTAPSPSARPLRWTLALLFGLTTLFALPALAAEPNPTAANAALDWLRTQQTADGGFLGFTGESDPSSTADAVYAFAAAGVDPASVTMEGGADPLTYLIAQASGTAGNPGAAGKLLLALHAAGLPPDAAEPVDLVGEVNAGYDPATGFYGQGLYQHTLAVLALTAYDLPVEQGALELFATAQIDDGSWGFTGEPIPGTGDSNTTALVVQALVSAGGDAQLIDSGVAYLLTLQRPDGSFAYDANTEAGDANSTALVIQALVAAGSDPAALPNGDALAALAAFQNPSGAFYWQAPATDDNLLATTQAVPALMLLPFPIPPVTVQPPGDDPLLDALVPQPPLADCAHSAATMHNVCGIFAEYWAANGGLAVFGYPLSETYTDESGMQVQYFERARFEHHPELEGTSYDVLLSRLGADIWKASRPFEPLPEPDTTNCMEFPETGQRVCGAFAEIWARDGGLAIFGYPLTVLVDEGGVAVQYFERARFELRPGEWPANQDVFLGRLGAETIEHVLAE